MIVAAATPMSPHIWVRVVGKKSYAAHEKPRECVKLGHRNSICGRNFTQRVDELLNKDASGRMRSCG
jgi:hypothetical protein